MAQRRKTTKKKTVEEKNEDVFGIGNTDSFCDDVTVEDGIDDVSPSMDEFEKNCKTFALPQQDHQLSYLLSREKDGEIMITDRQMFPMKEGYILVYVEYKLL